tara:strand:+ start:1452 stop:3197 length:1746 start_codon:yes stop_codon:yes gene_type:complete
MNVIYSGFVHPLIGVLSAFLIIFGSEFLGRQLLKNSFSTFFFLNLAVGIIAISLIAYILILLEVSKLTNPILAYTLLFLGTCNIFILLKNYNYPKKISLRIFFILLIIFSLFILSITAPTMADSLDYHLGVANYINQNHKWPNPNMWLHANISGLGEVYNSLGLIVYSDVTGSLTQLVALSSFLHYFSNIIKENQRIILFNLFILSSPVIIFLLSGAKFLLFPQLVTTLVLYFLVRNKQLSKNLFVLVVFLLCGAASFKLSFFISGIILGIVALIKINFNYKLIFKATLIALLFFAPKALFNFYNIKHFGFVDIFSVVPDEFVSNLKNFRENNFFFPINLFIPESLGKISTVLGIHSLFFFLMKDLNKENIQILTIGMAVSILYFFYSMAVGRMYYEILLWLSLCIVFHGNFKISIQTINFFLFISSSVVFLLIIFGLYNLAPSLLSNQLRKEVMINNAHEYQAANWINEKIGKEKVVMTNLRSIALLNARSIPMDYLNYNIPTAKLGGYFNFLKKSKINYLILKNFSAQNHYLFKNCPEIKRFSSPIFTRETRNPLNRVGEYYVTIIELDVNRSNSCIEN